MVKTQPMEGKDIFIHIPKTGGTTVNSAINKTDWQTEQSFFYRHINKQTKYSASGDIFAVENFDKYREYNVFTMLRDPLDRLISEYYFLRERKNYIQLLSPEPNNFTEFASNPLTGNYMLNFLLGRRMYDPQQPAEDDLKQVIEIIDTLPVYVGIFEFFAESLEYFKENTGITLDNDIEVKRMTFNRPEKNVISDDLLKIIHENNSLDYALYEHCYAKFEKLKEKYKKNAFQFAKSKYNHVIPYASTFLFFEFCIDDKHFLKQNQSFFVMLTRYLLDTIKIRDGREFTATWNATFDEAVSRHFPNSEFSEIIFETVKSNEDPLKTTQELGAAVDSFFKINGKKVNKYYKRMKFDTSMVKRVAVIQDKPTIDSSKRRIGFFKKLFSN